METHDIAARTAEALKHTLRILQDEEGYANSRVDSERYHFKPLHESVSFTQFWVKNTSARESNEAKIDALVQTVKSCGLDITYAHKTYPKSTHYDLIVMVHGLDKPEAVDGLTKLEALNAQRQEKLDIKQHAANERQVQSAITAAIGRLPTHLSPEQAEKAVEELNALAARMAEQWGVPYTNAISQTTHAGNIKSNEKQHVAEVSSIH